MGIENSPKPLKELPSNLNRVFSPLYRIEALTGLAGYGLIIDGAIKGNGKEVITGLVVSALSGFYGAYRDGAFSNRNKSSKRSSLENFTDK